MYYAIFSLNFITFAATSFTFWITTEGIRARGGSRRGIVFGRVMSAICALCALAMVAFIIGLAVL